MLKKAWIIVFWMIWKPGRSYSFFLPSIFSALCSSHSTQKCANEDEEGAAIAASWAPNRHPTPQRRRRRGRVQNATMRERFWPFELHLVFNFTVLAGKILIFLLIYQALFLCVWDKTQATKNSRFTKTQAKNCLNSSKIFPKLRFAGQQRYFLALFIKVPFNCYGF